MPEVSVLMGIYNEKDRRSVRLAVDSVLNQTLQDFEFIICDDGSPEKFYQWLEGLCKKDRRIVLLRSRANMGLAHALNRCLQHSGGRFAARMDADDIAAPRRLEKQAAFLREHKKYALAGSWAWLIDSRGAWGMRRTQRTPGRESFLQTSPFIHPSVMIRRSAMIRLGGYCESRKILRAEDYDFFMRLYAAGGRGYNLQEPLLAYREDRGSCAERKYRYRIGECRVRLAGFRRLGILKGNFRFVLKPLAAGLVPGAVLRALRRRRFSIPEKEQAAAECFRRDFAWGVHIAENPQAGAGKESAESRRGRTDDWNRSIKL